MSHKSITDWSHFTIKLVVKVRCVYFILSARRTLHMSIQVKDIEEITTLKDLSLSALKHDIELYAAVYVAVRKLRQDKGAV